MVVFDHRPTHQGMSFVLCPDRSLSWAGMRTVLVALLCCLGGISLYFTLNGAWLVLPFTGLEALVLTIAIYLNAQSATTRETITLTDKEISVARGRRTLGEAARFQRYWCQVALVRDPRGWYPSRLYLGSHGRCIEIGKMLVENERRQLASQLTTCIRQKPTLEDLSRSADHPTFETATQQI